jgi:hypothetical protein
VTFPGVTCLEVTTSTSPGDTLALLAAFPALEGLRLNMVPIAIGPDEVSVSATAIGGDAGVLRSPHGLLARLAHTASLQQLLLSTLSA